MGAPGRCYTRRAPRSASKTAADGAFSMRQRVILIALCTAFALLAAACGSSGAQEVSNDSVAVVGDQQISKSDWDALIEQTRRNFKATNRAFPKQLLIQSSGSEE